jgi:hypothetical protein
LNQFVIGLSQKKKRKKKRKKKEKKEKKKKKYENGFNNFIPFSLLEQIFFTLLLHTS